MENSTYYSGNVGGMTTLDLVPLATAAQILDVGPEQVRRYIVRGLLPADKVGNLWLTSAAHVRSLRFGAPRRGRPLSPTAAWQSIIAGNIDIDDPWRHSNRGRISRWSGTAAMLDELLCHSDVVVSGIHAARAHGAFLDPLPDEAQVYLPTALTQPPAHDHQSPLEGFVPSGLGQLVVRSVDQPSWSQLLSIAHPADDPDALPYGSPHTLYASPAVAALDLAVSPHAREQDVAVAMTGPDR